MLSGRQKETLQVGGVAGRYGWHTQPLWLMTLLFILEIVVFFWVYQNIKLGKSSGEWLLYLLYGILTVLIFYSMYTPNIFGRGDWSDSYHAHAYFNSIYNVHWGMPYTGELTSIYGHYGFFWKLPMKLIGGDFRKFVILLAGLGAISHLCAFLAMHQVIKSRLLRVLGAIAISFPNSGNERWILLAGVAAPYDFPCHYAVICGDSSQKKTVWLENGIIGIFVSVFWE